MVRNLFFGLEVCPTRETTLVVTGHPGLLKYAGDIQGLQVYSTGIFSTAWRFALVDCTEILAVMHWTVPYCNTLYSTLLPNTVLYPTVKQCTVWHLYTSPISSPCPSAMHPIIKHQLYTALHSTYSTTPHSTTLHSTTSHRTALQKYSVTSALSHAYTGWVWRQGHSLDTHWALTGHSHITGAL